ncbi:MAG: DUF4118 domain-containing protein [Verrucomicrobiota bacterium]
MNSPKHPKTVFLVSSASLVTVGVLDYVTGYEMSVALFYLIPVAVAAWFGGLRAGMLMAILSGTTWVAVDFIDGHQYARPIFRYWNGFMRFGIFAVTAILLAKLRNELRRQCELIEDLSSNHMERWEMGSLFPICSKCKKVRNDPEYLMAVQVFMEQHPQSIHSQCPECESACLKPELQEQK